MNISLANIIGIPHSTCDNHNLNLKVEDMHTNDRFLCELVEGVSRVGSSVRRSCKKSAIICQFTNIRAVTTCKTRWTESLMSLSRHLKISPGLAPIVAEENTDDMEKIITASYLYQVKTKVGMIKAIGDDNIYSQGRYALDLLIKEVR